MCQITDIQISGQQWDATGAPSAIEVVVRTIDCSMVDIDVFATPSDTTPLLSAAGVAAAPVPQTQQRLAKHTFAVTAQAGIQCGAVVSVRVRCSTDPTCARTEPVMVQCKGFAGAECPVLGPALDIQPPINQLGDCVPAGTYTIMIGGTWPTGTAFDWKLGDLPPGTTAPTGNHTDTFTLTLNAGASGKILIAEVTAPGCDDVESVAIFPPAQDVTCPDTVTFEIVGGGTTQTLSWAVGQPPLALTDVPAGDYTVRVTAPSDPTASFEWYRDNAFVPAGANPNELQINSLTAGASTALAVIVRLPCCDPLFATLVLAAADTVTPPPPPPPPFCAIWGVIVGVALIASLMLVVAGACVLGGIVAILSAVGGIAISIVAAVLLLLICGPDWCRIFGIIAWALKWAIVLGFVLALVCLGLAAFVTVLVMGMVIAAIIWGLVGNGCPVPDMLSLP